MLLKDLPEPIRKLAEQRIFEHCEKYGCLNRYQEKLKHDLEDQFDWELTKEVFKFWLSINVGNFTLYYAKYGLPEKWCIKCLPEWVDSSGHTINKDWVKCAESIDNRLCGNYLNGYYHFPKYCNTVIYTRIQEGYTEITLADWLAANPEKKEGVEPVTDEYKTYSSGITFDPSQFDPITKPKHYNSHPSGIECIEITQHHDFCTGNAIKYLWRQGLKDGENSITDLKKAVWYIERKIKQLENLGK